VSSKRQQTIAKLTRERLVKERRALKLEKKQAAREAKAAGIAPAWQTDGDVEEAPDVDEAPDAEATPDDDSQPSAA
jgi:hypothetical protein